jgi:hypothetical protein
MKQLFLIVFILFDVVFHISAQNIKQMVIEPDSEATASVFSGSCNSPELGVVVFKTAISGLWFEMYPPSKLINTRYNRQRNEYVMCVEPTDGKYRFTITHADYETVDFFVENMKPSQAQFFKITSKTDDPPKKTNDSIVAPRPGPVHIETPNRRMGVKLTNMELINNGKDFLLEFLLTNSGQDINDYSFYGGYSSESMAYDNLGTKLIVDVGFNGRNASEWSSGASGPIPGNIPIKIRVGVYKINPRATHLTQIRVKGSDGFFIFKNVPLR